ncbi:MAG: lysylphosphatidylglycerol synthase transmembrane domain-containing protein [Verrucomicrobiota bacterium]|nr:lysylphosphatidylglycerol synthase transmembrane domain-containing protein [Verrucomicrobiota bacterium]
MKSYRAILGMAGRILVSAVLLLWIFHAIFMEQGKLLAASESIRWQELPRMEQWRMAWFIGPKALCNILSLTHWSCFLLSLLCVGATVTLGAWRWHLLLKAQEISVRFRKTFQITMIGQFFNGFLLGSTGGDVLKAWYGTRETEKSKTEAITTVFVDRLLGLFSMLLFAVFFMLPNHHLLLVNKRLTLLTLFTLGMFGSCTVLIFAAGHGGLLSTILGRFRRLTPIHRSLEACKKTARQPRLMLKVFLLSMLLNGFCVAQFVVVSRDLGLQIGVTQLAVIVPMIICISSIPITPSGLGVRENLYVIMLGAPMLAIPPAKALALSLIAYAGFLCWSALGSFFYLAYRSTRKN